MSDCVFCKIVSGEIATPKLYEDSTAIVTFELNPASFGHVLIIFKEHAQSFSEMDVSKFINYQTVVRFMQRGLTHYVKPKGYHVLTNSGEVANQQSTHLITHVIPIKGDEEMAMGWKPKQFNQEQLTDLAKKLLTLQKEEEKKAAKVIKKETKNLFNVVKMGDFKRLKP